MTCWNISKTGEHRLRNSPGNMFCFNFSLLSKSQLLILYVYIIIYMYINKHIIHIYIYIYIYPRPRFYKEEDPEALTWDEQLTSRWQGEIPKLNRPFL